MIVITGASGLIGKALTKTLTSESQPLRLQVRKRANLNSIASHTNVQITELDFQSSSDNQISRLLQDAHTVIHTAGLVHQPDATYGEYELLNVRLTEQLSSIAAKSTIKTFVFLSTSAVYGPGPFEDIPEAGPLKAETPYAVSKLRCEQFLQNLKGLERIIVIRPALVFGEGDRGNLLSLIRQINKGLYFNIGGNKARKSLIYAEDIALAIKLCLAQAPSGYHEFNVANPETVTVEDLSNQIAKCLKKSITIPAIPESLVRAGAMFSQGVLGKKSPVTVSQIDKLLTTTTCSVEKLKALTQFSPSCTLEAGLKKEIDWAVASGLLN